MFITTQAHKIILDPGMMVLMKTMPLKVNMCLYYFRELGNLRLVQKYKSLRSLF